MERRGLLVRTERGIRRHMVFTDPRADGPVHLRYYDATHPEARALHLGAGARELLSPRHQGLVAGRLTSRRSTRSTTTTCATTWATGWRSANLYPLLHQQAFYEGMQAAGETEIVTLCRSAWAGSQRYGAAVWSGDIPSTFEALQAQVRAGLNIGLSGIPWWTTDIGGFHGGDTDEPVFPRADRALVPVRRLLPALPPARRRASRSQTGLPAAANEVWSFGDEAYAIIRELLFLRERLRPYIMAQMAAAAENGHAAHAAAVLRLPRRPGLLRCRRPVHVRAGPPGRAGVWRKARAAARSICLPGRQWNDAWTGEAHAGGAILTAAAPLARIPVFVRDRALLALFQRKTDEPS